MKTLKAAVAKYNSISLIPLILTALQKAGFMD